MTPLTTKAAEIRATEMVRQLFILQRNKRSSGLPLDDGNLHLIGQAAALIEQQAAELAAVGKVKHYLRMAEVEDPWSAMIDECEAMEARATTAESERGELLREKERLGALARKLSDALLTIRPLGGSELFMRVGEDFYADPAVCSTEIAKLREHMHNAKANYGRVVHEKWALKDALGKIASLTTDSLARDRARSALAEEPTQNVVKNLSEDGQHLSPAGERSATNG